MTPSEQMDIMLAFEQEERDHTGEPSTQDEQVGANKGCTFTDFSWTLSRVDPSALPLNFCVPLQLFY